MYCRIWYREQSEAGECFAELAEPFESERIFSIAHFRLTNPILAFLLFKQVIHGAYRCDVSGSASNLQRWFWCSTVICQWYAACITISNMQFFAQPWWVNLLILVPITVAYFWHARPLQIAPSQLAWAGAFAGAFGFVEASVVVYLRAAVGLLPGYQGTLADVVRLSRGLYERGITANEVALPPSLVSVELFREAATIVMLVAVAMLAAGALRTSRNQTHAASKPVSAWKPRAENWAIFLWCFAIWDAAYYAALWATIRWPNSLTAPDVLFLIPVPWFAQVWFPLLIDVAVMVAVLHGCRPQSNAVRSPVVANQAVSVNANS